MVQQMSCQAYVAGVIDTTESLAVLSGTPRNFCFPKNAAIGDAIEAVKNRWRRHRSQVPASVLVMQALKAEFPCSKKIR
jgi:hypothetical protein